MYNLKNTTKLSDVLYTLLCVIRLLVFMPLILTCLCFVPLMYLLGIKNAIDKWVKLNEAIVFDVVERSEHCSGCEGSTGETKPWCCNHCGKRIEDF